jgi:adenylate cyclase class IV
LRASSVEHNGVTRYYLGWKGPDTGKFANVRRELNEEITHGSTGSAIMEWLTGAKMNYTRQEVVPAIERSGRQRFMSYQGQNLAGRYDLFGVNVKLMHCEALKWPLLVEIEKIAANADEAQKFEHELVEISRRFQLQDHIVKEEPGTLLYEATFKNNRKK